MLRKNNKYLLLLVFLVSGCSNVSNESVNPVSEETKESVSVTEESVAVSEKESSSVSEEPSISQQASEEVSSEETPAIEYVDLFEGSKIAEINPSDSDPHITVEKDTYAPGEEMTISAYNCSSTDWVGLYPEGGYPQDMSALVWKYTTSDTISFSAATFKNETKYNLFLCKDGGYVVLDKKPVTVKSTDTTDYKIKDARYDYEDNEMIVAITPSTSKELTYEIYWAKDGERLEDYEYVKTFKKASKEKFVYSLGTYLFMPDEANQLEFHVVNGNSTSVFIDVDDSAKVNSNYLYSFNVYTDMHIRTYTDKPNHVEHLQAALNDAYYYNRNSKALFSVGDQIDRGLELEYTCIGGLIDTYKAAANCPVYYTLGNHDYAQDYNTEIALFKKYAEVDDIFYTKEMEGSTCIFMGSDDNSCGGIITETHVEWLKQELEKADKDKPIYIFLHQPLIDTISGSYEEQNWYGISNTGREIEKILSQYKNTFLFTGHTHWEMESNNNILVSQTGTTYINCASVGYLWNDDDSGEPGSEGYFIDVYDDCLLVRGRDFTKEKWLGYATYRIPPV